MVIHKIVLAAMLLGLPALAQAEDDFVDTPIEVAAGSDIAETAGITDLKKTLAEVLKARRQEEFDYINKVVTLVDQKKLPLEMVESTFNWARKKPRHQFQYFEAALRVRAKEIGVNL